MDLFNDYKTKDLKNSLRGYASFQLEHAQMVHFFQTFFFFKKKTYNLIIYLILIFLLKMLNAWQEILPTIEEIKLDS